MTFPKAPARQQTTKGRKRRKGYFYRYARQKLCVKNFELVQPKSKNVKKVGKKVRTKLIVENIKPIKRHPKKTKSKNVNESPGEDEWFCLICVGPYSNSRAGEKWIKSLGSRRMCTSRKDLYMPVIVTQTMNTFKF